MLLKDYDGRDPSGMWISEKLDGVRGLWTGAEFLTRTGNKIDCPAWFTEGFPDFPLDGELWAGRGQFQIAKGMVASKARDSAWRQMIFGIFDAPGENPLEERFAVLRCLSLPPHACIVHQVVCKGVAHLLSEFEAVKKLGGEGLVLRIPNSPYVEGRSLYWQKVKHSPTGTPPRLESRPAP